MVILDQTRECGALGGKLNWAIASFPQEDGSTRRLDTRHIQMQQMKDLYIKSNPFKKNMHKKYRILLHSLRTVVSDATTSKYIIAESDDVREILRDWKLLETQLQPMLSKLEQDNTGTSSNNGGGSGGSGGKSDKTLLSLDALLKFVRNLKHNTKNQYSRSPTSRRRNNDGKHVIDLDDLSSSDDSDLTVESDDEKYDAKFSTINFTAPVNARGGGGYGDDNHRNNRQRQAGGQSGNSRTQHRTAADRKVQLKINDTEEASNAIVNFQTLANTLKTQHRLLGTTRETDRVRQSIKQTVQEAQTMNKSLIAFFDGHKKAGSRDMFITKLNNQYRELRDLMDKLTNDPKVKRACDTAPSVRNNSRTDDVAFPSTSNRHHQRHNDHSTYGQQHHRRHYDGDDDNEDDYGFNGQLQQYAQRKYMLTDAAQSTIDVERSIAEEQLEEMRTLESDFNELSEMVRDFHQLTTEQDTLISTIEENVQSTANYVDKGNKHLKQASKASKWFMG